MLVRPGPALAVIPIGLAILALEFAWAGRLLEMALEQAEKAQAEREGDDERQRIVVAVAVVLGVAAIGVAMLSGASRTGCPSSATGGRGIARRRGRRLAGMSSPLATAPRHRDRQLRSDHGRHGRAPTPSASSPGPRQPRGPQRAAGMPRHGPLGLLATRAWLRSAFARFEIEPWTRSRTVPSTSRAPLRGDGPAHRRLHVLRRGGWRQRRLPGHAARGDDLPVALVHDLDGLARRAPRGRDDLGMASSSARCRPSRPTCSGWRSPSAARTRDALGTAPWQI